MVHFQGGQAFKTDEFSRVSKWIEGIKFNHPSGILNDILVIYDISREPKLSNNGFESEGYVKNISIVRICYSCGIDGGKQYGTLITTEVELFERSHVIRFGFPLPDENIVWKLQDSSFKGDLVSIMLANSRSCESNNFRNIWSKILSEPSLLEKVGMGHSDVFRWLMKNFTLNEKYKKGNCNSQGKFKFFVSVESSQYHKSFILYPYYTTDVLNNFRFIGCGHQGMHKLAFKELTNAFSKHTWFALASTIISVSISIKLLWPKTYLSTNLLSIIKVVLEQGDCIPEKIESNSKYRYLGFSLFLMGVVLSNAYKNTNLYNMVVPRKPILYSKFNELLRDNFQIFTRSKFVSVASTSLNDDMALLSTNIKNTTIRVRTELQAFANIYRAREHYME